MVKEPYKSLPIILSLLMISWAMMVNGLVESLMGLEGISIRKITSILETSRMDKRLEKQ